MDRPCERSQQSGNEADAIRQDTIRMGRGDYRSDGASGLAEMVWDTIRDPRSLQIPGTEKTPEGEQLMVAPLFARDESCGGDGCVA